MPAGSQEEDSFSLSIPITYIEISIISNLIHASIGKKQSRIVQGDGGRRMHIGVLIFDKEVDESLSDLTGCQCHHHLEIVT